MIALLLTAAALGLSNFGAAIAIGVSGVDARTRWRVGLVFGLFEGGMPVAGLALGHGVADSLGSASRWIGAGLLIGTGAYALVQAVRGGEEATLASAQLGRLLVAGLALSIDNLAVGFALGTRDVSVWTAAAVIAAVSVLMSLVGLELGARIGVAAGRRGETVGAVVLLAVGVMVAAGVL